MIMDLRRVTRVRGVITQGREDKQWEFPTSFTVQYSSDGVTWQAIHKTFSPENRRPTSHARAFFPLIQDPTRTAAAPCVDTPNFIDEGKHPCSDWLGFNCRTDPGQYYYSAQGKAALLWNCRASCASCDYTTTTTAGPPSSRMDAASSATVDARYLKLLITSWHAWISLRAAAIICEPPRRIMERIKVNVGVPVPSVHTCSIVTFNPDESHRSYSSVYQNDAPGTGHRRSMLDSPQAWSAARAVAGEYMIMDMGEVALIRGLITQGRGDHKSWEYVKRFQVALSVDGSTWEYLHERFKGILKPYHRVLGRWRFPDLVQARYLKLTVLSWNAWVSMRAGAFVCDVA